MDHRKTITKVLLVFAVSIHLSSGGYHVLKYLHIGVTQGDYLPVYTSVGLVDDEQFVYYDSNIRERIPKTEWIKNNEDTDYWNSETQILQGHESWFRDNMASLKQRFNQTGGIHTWQWMYGCELNDDGTVRGYNQYGYDGEDFISLDLNTLSWTAANSVAVITKKTIEATRDLAVYQKNYLENTCIEYLKQYLGFGGASLNRKVPPEVTLFQKESSSPVVCHATGFFPGEVTISWKKNGEDLCENTELRETLPNHDGTFQKRSILTVSPEDLDKNEFTCVVQHSGLEKNVVRRAAKPKPQNASGTKQETVPMRKGSHSLQYFYIAVTPGINFPEFTSFGLVDGEQIDYYDSNIRKDIPKTEWMEKSEGPDYWDRQTQNSQGDEENFKNNLAVAMGRFNQSKGVHTFQRMYGCEIHDDGTKRAYNQYSYDGEDFISLDLNTNTWIAPNAQAFITKVKWDANKANTEYLRNYFMTECIEWIKKYVSYGKDTLERKVRPEVTLFQKDSSSPVVCHATGFFPRGVMISWKKNGEDLHEDVELRETSPNQDGTFQKRSILTVSPKDLKDNKYTCVVQHISLDKDIEMPFQTGGGSVGVIVGAVVAVLLLVLIVCVGLFIWRKKKNDFKPVAPSDGEASSTSSK